MTNLISRKFLIFLLFAAAIGNALLVKAQTYPVQVTTTLTPPYSVYLSDYGSATSNALQVFINLLELDRTNLRVKLRLTIEGAGIILTTRSTYVPQAIVLQGGIPEMLTGYDLRGYLNPDNLEFSGITKAEFLKSGKLPEGFYTFKFEVIEIIRNVRISSPMGGQASAWMVLNDPPLVNQPFNGDKLTVTNPQNVLFSWTPRHTASPNAAFATEYEFRLVELYPGQTNPDIAIRSSNSLFTTTTTFTSLNYGIIDPTLIPGKKYAFRIRAYDTSGKDLFKNGGYSETYFFQYGDACSLPSGISGEALDAERIKVAWEPEIAHSKFVINLRKAGSRNWYSEENFSSAQIFPDLKPETQYEYQIQSYCGASPGEMSSIFTVSTPKMEEALVEAETKFACGADSPALGEEEQDCTIPLQKPLLPLDRMKQGDWGVIVSQVSVQPDGSYSGKGHIGVPMLNALNLRVRFENVRLNEHYRMISGVVKTIYDDTNAPFSIGSVEEEEGEIGEEREELEGELGDEGEEDHEGDVVAENGEATENGESEMPSDSLFVATNSESSSGSSNSTGEGSGEASEDPGTGTEVAAGDSAGTGSEVASGGGAGTEEVVEGDSISEISGLSRNVEFVAIHSVTETFTPGKERVNINYTIKDTLGLDYIRMEVFKTVDDKEEEVIAFFNLSKGEKVNFIDDRDNKKGWSGTNAEGTHVEAGTYQVKIVAAIDDTFENGFEDYESFRAKNPNYQYVNKDSISNAAKDAVDLGTGFVGNKTTAACNICTRAAVYISTGKGNDDLFPKIGSRIGNDSSAYLKGEINKDGKANDIYDDLKDAIVVKYEFIPNLSNEDYPDFSKLQDDVNDGQIIVGTYRNNDGGSGHIVMIVPGKAEKHFKKPNDYKYKSTGIKIEFPKILECGTNHRESSTPIYDNISTSKLKLMRWYRLKLL